MPRMLKRRPETSDVPIKLLTGAKDPRIPMGLLAGAPPSVHIASIEDAGHYLPHERADVVIAAARELFSSATPLG